MSPHPIDPGETDPASRVRWSMRVESDLEALKLQLDGLKEQLAEVTRMKWLPVKVLATSALVVVFALSAYAVFFILRTDAVEAKALAGDAQVRAESVAANARQDAELNEHKAEERDARMAIQRTVEKIADVVVYQRPPAVVRSEP